MAGAVFEHKPNDAVQTVDLLVGVSSSGLLLHKRCRDYSFGLVCHFCYQTSDWVIGDGPDTRCAWIKKDKDGKMKGRNETDFLF